MGLSEVLAALQTKPAKRESHELQTLATYFRRQPFFAGVDFTTLQQICSIITLQRASPGEVLLHSGELTDRMYLLLSGRCTIVRHSKKEGYVAPPPQTLRRGQALAEAALVLSGRRSDVAAVVAAAPVPTAAAAGDAGAGTSAGGAEAGAAFAVITRTAWGNMCARAPMQPICGAARTAVLNCCARSLAAAEPERRTMEQSDDLGAVLRQLPGMAGTPPPVLRALSEAAALRRLPAGTILYEEHTRAESQFVVLAGAVQVRCRQQKLGQSRAAIRSAMRAVVLRRNQSSVRRNAAASEAAAARAAAEVDGDEAAARGGKSVREKIQEERREREAALESVKLTREGLRDPEPAKPVAHGEKSKKFMMEFISRAKQTLNTNDAAPIFSTPSAVAPEALSEGPTTVAPPASPGEPLAPTTPTSSLAPSAPSTAPPSRAASAWHRAALKLTHSGEEGSQGGAGPQLVGAGEGDDYDESDPMLLEYQRRKAEEAGLVSDVGNLLGGAGARSAHLRGIAAARSGKAHFYDHSEEERDEDKDGKHGGHVRWADGGAADGGAVGDADGDADAGVEADAGDGPSVSRVKLVFMDKNYCVASKSVRFVDAVEKLVRLVRERGESGGGATFADAADGDPGGGGGEPTILHVADPSVDVEAAAPLLEGASAGGRGRGRSGRASGVVPAGDNNDERDGDLDGADDEDTEGAEDDDVDEDAVEEEHLEQLYGPVSGRVEPGALAGELPPAALSRATGAGTAASSGSVGPTPVPARHRRANTAIAAAAGADVLVIALEALRRGAEAVRSDLVAERLAVLGALEPLRGLSEEHQAAVALGAAVISVDSNALVVQQGQTVDALYVVLDGEVRLLDDPDSHMGGGTGAGASPQPGAAWGRTISLDSAALSKAMRKGAADASGGNGGGGGAGAEGGHGAIKARRAAAALSTLSLLGPGGSFGESVLGYPADLARQEEELAAAKANAWTQEGEDGEDSPRDQGGFVMGHAASFNRHSAFASAGAAAASAAGGSGGGAAAGGAAAVGRGSGLDANTPPPSFYMASAVATKPSRLLVLPRQLLGRYGYLRAALPPFAEARREALLARRGQIKGTPANMVASGLSSAASVPVPHGTAAASPWSAAGGASGAPPLQQSPSLPAPRPPPPRPVEFLEQMGFKSLSNPRTNALLASGGGSGGSGGASPSPDRRGALVSSSCRGFESLGGSASAGGAGTGTDAGSGLTFSAPVPPNLPSPTSNAASPSGPGAPPSAATAPGGAGVSTPPPGGSGAGGLMGSRALGTTSVSSSFRSGGGGLRSRMLSSGGTAPGGSGGGAGLYGGGGGGGGGGLGGSFGLVRSATGQLGQVTEDAALQELAGADGGPGRGALPAAMQQAARYEQMSGGELDMLTTKPGEESWQAVGAAAAGGRAPPKPRIARTSMTGGGSPGASQRSLGLSGASNKRMSISGLSTYGNSSFGAAPAGASSGGGAIPSVSAAGTDGPNTRTSVSGGGFLHRLESRGRGGDMGGRPALLTVESFVEGGAGGGSSTESPRGTGPPPGIAGGPFGAPAPSPIPSHLSTAGVRQGISSTPLPYINTGTAGGGGGGGGGSNPNSGNASALARLALAGAAGSGGGAATAAGLASRGSSGASTPTAAGTGLYGYGMGGSPASGGGSGGMRPMRNSYTGSPITVSVSPAYGAGTPASPAGFSSVAGGSIFAAIAATVDAPSPPPGGGSLPGAGPVPTGWFTSTGSGGSGGGAATAAPLVGAPGGGGTPPPVRSTSRKTFGITGGTAGAAAAAAAAAAVLSGNGLGSVAGWQPPPPPAAAGLLPTSALASQQGAAGSAPGTSRQLGAAAMRVSWDGSTLRGAAAAQRQQQGQQRQLAAGGDVAATAALLAAQAQQPVAMLGAIGGGGGGGGGSGGGGWL
ncbi:hypothetical protein CHLRE_07g343200v5 [Chlamydomonas reinhardtii]|uniref:Cyclic nucleotide-binding domain-containing protein n=1 Tax=Chlamydomonas reinhardtii TaxID=3055 RepID=A0A2K3DKQ4_CHLRE|nr:uncharacterized protein CHLRE_07g343200v5 [Chlamydomonas reinhardtii]PNW81115.1 hypothetical protein CHLRE_07g343200v5 [Chlamydomonas reinhardtii]